MVAGIWSSVFVVRDLVSTYAPVPARAAGLGWFASQPRPNTATHPVEDGSCEFWWRQNGFTTAKYTMRCKARRKPIVLTGFAILSDDEDQRPMSGEEVRVDPGRTWSYDGEVSLGMIDNRDTVELTVTVLPDRRKLVFTSAEP